MRRRNLARLELVAFDGGTLEIGERTLVNYGGSIAAGGLVRIGSRCQIGTHAIIMDMRMPVVDGRLRGLDVFDHGRVIWAVGDQGLLIGTRDGGRSWLRGTIVAEAVPAGAAASKPRPLKAFNFIPSAHAGESPVAQTPVQSPMYGKDDPSTNVAQSKLPDAPTRAVA